MNKRIEELKAELREELKKESSSLTVRIELSLNSYGWNTLIEERTPEHLKTNNQSMRNIEGGWIK